MYFAHPRCRCPRQGGNRRAPIDRQSFNPTRGRVGGGDGRDEWPRLNWLILSDMRPRAQSTQLKPATSERDARWLGDVATSHWCQPNLIHPLTTLPTYLHSNQASLHYNQNPNPNLMGFTPMPTKGRMTVLLGCVVRL